MGWLPSDRSQLLEELRLRDGPQVHSQTDPRGRFVAVPIKVFPIGLEWRE